MATHSTNPVVAPIIFAGGRDLAAVRHTGGSGGLSVRTMSGEKTTV